MAIIHMIRKHDFAQADALVRVESVARELKKKIHMDYAWEGNSLKFKRTGASGTINVGKDSIDVNVKLSMFLAPIKGKIEGAIHEQFDVALGKDDGTTKIA